MRQKLAKAFELFQATHSKNGKPEMADPFAIDMKDLEVKIHRDFAGALDVKKFSELTGIKFVFGNGSRGAHGVNNAGSLFERRLTEDFQLYSKIRNPDSEKYFYKKFIHRFHDEYGSRDVRDITVIPEGALNKKRPLVFTGSSSDPVYIGQPWSQAGEVGKMVTDITVEMDTNKVYISCKAGGTVTFFNIGITKYILAPEVMGGEIKDPKGQILLDLFGLDYVWFCSVFKAAAGGSKNLPMTKQLVQDLTNKIDRIKLEHFLLSGVGYGYHLVHAKNANEDSIDDLVMNKENSKRFLQIQQLVAKYPALGTSKRINVYITTPKFKFAINFRNSGGGISPDKLSCDYTMNVR